MGTMTAILTILAAAGVSPAEDPGSKPTPPSTQPAFVLENPDAADPDILPFKGVANRSGAPLRSPKGPHLRPATHTPASGAGDFLLYWTPPAPESQPATTEKWRAFDALHTTDFYKAHR